MKLFCIRPSVRCGDGVLYLLSMELGDIGGEVDILKVV